MNERMVERVIAEANEFIDRATRVLTDPDSLKDGFGTKYTAALRRKSMDLTRVLAELRNPWAR